MGDVGGTNGGAGMYGGVWCACVDRCLVWLGICCDIYRRRDLGIVDRLFKELIGGRFGARDGAAEGMMLDRFGGRIGRVCEDAMGSPRPGGAE